MLNLISQCNRSTLALPMIVVAAGLSGSAVAQERSGDVDADFRVPGFAGDSSAVGGRLACITPAMVSGAPPAAAQPANPKGEESLSDILAEYGAKEAAKELLKNLLRIKIRTPVQIALEDLVARGYDSWGRSRRMREMNEFLTQYTTPFYEEKIGYLQKINEEINPRLSAIEGEKDKLREKISRLNEEQDLSGIQQALEEFAGLEREEQSLSEQRQSYNMAVAEVDRAIADADSVRRYMEQRNDAPPLERVQRMLCPPAESTPAIEDASIPEMGTGVGGTAPVSDNDPMPAHRRVAASEPGSFVLSEVRVERRRPGRWDGPKVRESIGNLLPAEELLGPGQRQFRFTASYQDYYDMDIDLTVDVPEVLKRGSGPFPIRAAARSRWKFESDKKDNLLRLNLSGCSSPPTKEVMKPLAGGSYSINVEISCEAHPGKGPDQWSYSFTTVSTLNGFGGSTGAMNVKFIYDKVD